MSHSHGYDLMTDAELLAKVQKGWKCEETPCGTGSTIENTKLIRSHLPKIVETYNIQSVADVGAGDLHWMPLVEWDVSYQGYDLFPRHPDVLQFDATKEVLPKVDLIICRHVLNHLSIQYTERILENFKASGSRYLLITNNPKQTAFWEEFDFSMGNPLATYPDCQNWWLELHAN